MVKVGVIGAGAVGLAAAVNTQLLVKNAEVTLIADKFTQDTTSNGAGGFFRPNLDQIVGDVPTVIQWIKDSWEFYDKCASSPEARESGMSYVSGTVVYNTPQDRQYAPIRDLVRDFHALSEEELKRQGLSDYKYGYFFTTIIATTPVYLEWLMNRFIGAGGKVQRRHVEDLSELVGEFDLVVNCSGLMAKTLINDKQIYPVKGQLVMVKAPWVKNFFFSDDHIYFIPQMERLVIGGTREKDFVTDGIQPETSARILQRAQKLFPQLKGAEKLSEWVGFRPTREPVRVEYELFDSGPKGKLQVVHNYGHGGHGITLSWGCGKHAARLVQNALENRKSRL